MDRARGTLYLILTLAAFDLIVLFGVDLPPLSQSSAVLGFLNHLIGPDRMIGTVHPDVILSPLILLSIALHAYFVKPASKDAQRFIVIALILAAVTEFIQKGLQYNVIAGGNAGVGPFVVTTVMVLAAAGYYALYIIAFLKASPRRPDLRSLIPAGIFVVYAVLVVIGVQMPTEYIWQALLYLPVVAGLIAVGFLGITSGDAGTPSLLRAAGVLTLVVSDSLRAISVFKFGGSFLWSELLIMATFFAGQLAIARSVAVEERSMSRPILA